MEFLSSRRKSGNSTLSPLEVTSSYVRMLSSAHAEGMMTKHSRGYVLDCVYNDSCGAMPLTDGEADAFWPSWFKAFPEYDFEVTRTIAAEGTVVTEWIFTGTNTGALGPPAFMLPASQTGKTVRLRGVSFYDIKDGLIQRETVYIDLATLMVELGLGV